MPIQKSRIIAAMILFSAFHLASAWAETKTIDGLAVRMGIVPAEQASQAPGELQTHHRIPKSKSAQHLVVSLANAGNGERFEDAKVSVEVKNPLGQIQKKTLLHVAPAGPSNYGEYFRFDASGQYLITVFVLKPGQGEPFEAIFSENVP